ncbi:MAG: hypothetical protein U0822_21115 [Anaerolineae bacterium]
MSANLIPFLENLVEDPEALADFQDDPELAVANADLSPDEQAAILSRDPQRIRDVVMAEIQASTDADIGLPFFQAVVFCIMGPSS